VAAADAPDLKHIFFILEANVYKKVMHYFFLDCQKQMFTSHAIVNHVKLGKGHYYKNPNVKNQKEHRKICKPSQRQKWLLS
jgi:hypothetical protein